MKIKIVSLTALVVVGLLAACTASWMSASPTGEQAFLTATNSILFEGMGPVNHPDVPVALAGAPTVASVFRMQPSATPSPIPSSTLPPEVTGTPSPAPQSQTVLIYGEKLNPNWEVQKRSSMTFDLEATGQAYRGSMAISAAPRGKGDATLVFSVSDKSTEAYPRGLVTKLSFALYSVKTPLYLDQFSVSILGSNSQLYWSADDQSVESSGFESVFPQVRLDELGFDQAIPANTWVLVEIDLSKPLTLEPQYQYVTGISLESTTGPGHTLLIDNMRLTLLGKPPRPSELQFTPPANLR